MERVAKAGPRTRALAGATLFLLVLMLAWWWGDRWYQAQIAAEQRTEAALEVTLRGNVLSSILNRRFARLQGVNGFVQIHADETDDTFDREFRTFAAVLYDEARGVRAVTLAPDGVVQYVYPQPGNASVLGYRPLEDARPEVREDAERAIRTGNVVVSGPRQLVQGGFGLAVWRAVYREGAFWGLVGVTLDVQALLAEAGLGQSGGDLTYALRDGAGHVFFGEPDLFQRDPVINVVELPEGAWELAGVPVQGWAAAIRPELTLYRAVTLFAVFLLTSLAYMSINRQARLQEAVARRTREIAQASALLEQRVRERTRELETLLELSQNVTSTLELRPLLHLILQHLRVVVDYTAAGVYLYEIEEDGEPALNLLHSHGPIGEAELRDLWPSQRWPLAAAAHHQEVIERRAPVLISDVHADTELARAFRESMSYLGDRLANAATWMGVPLLVQDRVIGLLAFDYDQAGYYDERDARLALAFAGYAAIAIENAQLYAQARSLAILQERQRLARELHDSVSQALYGISLGTLTARRLWERDRPDDAQEALAYAHSLAETALTEMRSLIFELRPESLEEEGLVVALEKQAAALGARDEIAVDTDLCAEPAAPLQLKEVLYRVAQEALHNVVKHARANRVTLTLGQSQGGLTLLVRDDGRGFDPEQPFPGHLGLRSMRERVEQVGGHLAVDSAPGRGTEIRAEVPLVDER